MPVRLLWNIYCKGGIFRDRDTVPDSGALYYSTGDYAGIFPHEVLFAATAAKAYFVDRTAALASFCDRRHDVLCAPHFHHTSACSDCAAFNCHIHKNAPNFPVEIHNNDIGCLRGICLHQQPLKSDQCRHAHPSAPDTDWAMVLPSGSHLLQCTLLVDHCHLILSRVSLNTKDGGK